jgi:hypothetical protein
MPDTPDKDFNKTLRRMLETPPKPKKNEDAPLPKKKAKSQRKAVKEGKA